MTLCWVLRKDNNHCLEIVISPFTLLGCPPFQIALGEVDMAVGADQGGSIRIPASMCGVVSLKPTWGLVPYTGIASIDPSLDHAGPMAANVRDCALLLQVLCLVFSENMYTLKLKKS